MTDDDKMDALLRQMAVDDYNRPPEIVPREQMWDVVLQGLGQPAAGGRSGHTAPAVPLHRRVVRFHELAIESAIFVASLEADSPAARAGLREGDLIVGFDGRPTGGIDELHRLLTEERAGRSIPTAVVRGSERLTLTVVPAVRAPR